MNSAFLLLDTGRYMFHITMPKVLARSADRRMEVYFISCSHLVSHDLFLTVRKE